MDVSKYSENRWVWNTQSRKCQFSIQQCGQTPTLSLNSVCKIKEHACFHTQKEKSPGWRANIQRALLHTQRFLSDLAIRDHPTSATPPPLSLPLPPSLPDLLIADWERQAVQEHFNLALNWEKAENVFRSLCFMTHEQCRMVGGKLHWKQGKLIL